MRAIDECFLLRGTHQEAKQWARTVLTDTRFISDPIDYLKTWCTRRGGQEDLRIPEDPLYEIFCDVLQVEQRS